jgi:hypothetical protein
MVVVRDTMDHDQDMAASNEGCEDEDHEEEEDALGKLMEMVKSLAADIERLESEESAEDFPVLEADVLDSPTDDDSVEDFMTIEALHSTPEVPVVPRFDDLMIILMRSSRRCNLSHVHQEPVRRAEFSAIT